jgi:hypothetical protein
MPVEQPVMRTALEVLMAGLCPAANALSRGYRPEA